MYPFVTDSDGHQLVPVLAPNPDRKRLKVTAPAPLTQAANDLGGDQLARIGRRPIDAAPAYLAFGCHDAGSGDCEPHHFQALAMGESREFKGKLAQQGLYATAGVPGGLTFEEGF